MNATYAIQYEIRRAAHEPENQENPGGCSWIGGSPRFLRFWNPELCGTF